MLDASLLLMPLVKFLSPSNTRWLSTLDAISKELRDRQPASIATTEMSPDGLDRNGGDVSMCSFWLVEAISPAGSSTTRA